MPAPVGPISNTSKRRVKAPGAGQHVSGEMVAEARGTPCGVVADDPLGRALGGERVEPFGKREEIRCGRGHDPLTVPDAPPHAQQPEG